MGNTFDDFSEGDELLVQLWQRMLPTQQTSPPPSPLIRKKIKIENETQKSQKLKFSKDEESLLVCFVKNHAFLYDKSNKDFKNKFKKNQTWEELAQLMGNKDVQQVKKRWRNLRDYWNSKKKPQRTKKTTGKGSESEDENDNEADKEDLSFLNECSIQQTTFVDSHADVDLKSNSTTMGQPPLTPKLNKRKKQSNNDAIIAIMREKVDALKELANSSTAISDAYLSTSKSITQQYFDVYASEISLLPIELQSKCQREVQQAVTAIIHKFQDEAEESAKNAKERTQESKAGI